VLIDILNATDALVLVDEAYFEFSRHTMRPHMERHPNLVILRTFSKAFSLAGLRVGYLLGHEDVIRELTKVRQPYSVDSFAQWVAASVFRERVVFQQAIRDIMRGRDTLMHGLSSIEASRSSRPRRTSCSSASHTPRPSGATCCTVTRCSCATSRAPGLEDCLRVTVGSDEENERFLTAVEEVLVAAGASRYSERQRACAPRDGRGVGILMTAHRHDRAGHARDDIRGLLDLDGTHGRRRDLTGIPFFDHMLDALGRHGLMSLASREGDLEVDAHHTVEDVGICLGQAFAEALGDKAGIRRYGSAPSRWTRRSCSRPSTSRAGGLTYDVALPIEFIGTFETSLAKEFMVAFAPMPA
jgi:imidazoleglycerol phosphate dehydratase HisB